MIQNRDVGDFNIFPSVWIDATSAAEDPMAPATDGDALMVFVAPFDCVIQGAAIKIVTGSAIVDSVDLLCSITFTDENADAVSGTVVLLDVVNAITRAEGTVVQMPANGVIIYQGQTITLSYTETGTLDGDTRAAFDMLYVTLRRQINVNNAIQRQ